MTILGTGLNGLVGSRIAELLKNTYHFESLSRSSGVDISDARLVEEAVNKSASEVVLHFAAKTNVDACEEDKKYGKDGEAWKVNVLGTKNIVNACEKSGKKLIYISTDFIFNGEKDFYTEIDGPDPINWYGMTKCEGESEVQSSSSDWIIMRIAYPYRSKFEKGDFVRKIQERFTNKQEVAGVTDHIFCPTFVDDIAAAISNLIKQKATGIYHAVGSESLSPYIAATKIAETFGFNQKLISKTTRAEYFKDKAPRPFHLVLKNDKIEQLNVAMNSFSKGLELVKSQQATI